MTNSAKPTVLSIVKSYKTEFLVTIPAIMFLALLAYIAIIHDRIFEFLIVAFSWIQIEASYRQWWYERHRLKPQLAPRIKDSIVRSEDGTITDINLIVYVKNCGSVPAYNVQLWLEANNVKLLVSEIDAILQGKEKAVGRIDKKLLEPILQGSGGMPKIIKIILYYYDPIEVKTVHMEIRVLLSSQRIVLIGAPPEKPPGVLLNIPLLVRDMYEVIRERKSLDKNEPNKI
jgi:hypothetical protein